MEVLWLSAQDVRNTGLTAEECMGLVRKAVEWQTAGQLEAPPKLGIHPPKGRHIHAMPAFIPPMDSVGVKWIADFPQNYLQGLPTITALIILNSPETGVPLCVLEGGTITAMRTAAMTGVTLRLCANPDVRTATILGTGTQARAHAILLPKALPSLEAIRVVGLVPKDATAFCREMGPSLHCELIPFPDRGEAVRGTDVVVTVTTAVTTRLLEPDWLASGITAVVLDNGGKETTILHSMDRVIVDNRDAFASEEVRQRFPTGLPRIDADLGQILTGRLKGRGNAQERVLVLNLGIAVCDIAVATEVYRRAVISKLGVMMKF